MARPVAIQDGPHAKGPQATSNHYSLVNPKFTGLALIFILVRLLLFSVHRTDTILTASFLPSVTKVPHPSTSTSRKMQPALMSEFKNTSFLFVQHRLTTVDVNVNAVFLVEIDVTSTRLHNSKQSTVDAVDPRCRVDVH